MAGDIVTPQWASFAILMVVALQRLGELVLARINTQRLLAQGAVEVGAAHYPAIVAVHAAWLLTMVGWVSLAPPVINFPLMILYVLLQFARLWVLASLGPYWTTRIITLPHAPKIKRGPYRFMRHPNYVVVVLEIAALPLMFGAWPVALIFSLINAYVLRIRIRVENAALALRP